MTLRERYDTYARIGEELKIAATALADFLITDARAKGGSRSYYDGYEISEINNDGIELRGEYYCCGDKDYDYTTIPLVTGEAYLAALVAKDSAETKRILDEWKAERKRLQDLANELARVKREHEADTQRLKQLQIRMAGPTPEERAEFEALSAKLNAVSP